LKSSMNGEGNGQKYGGEVWVQTLPRHELMINHARQKIRKRERKSNSDGTGQGLQMPTKQCRPGEKKRALRRGGNKATKVPPNKKGPSGNGGSAPSRKEPAGWPSIDEWP